MDNAQVQRDLSEQATSGGITQRKASKAVRQRKGKASSKPRSLHLTFAAQNGIKVTVSASRKASYHEVEEALLESLEEVRHRISNNVQLY